MMDEDSEFKNKDEFIFTVSLIISGCPPFNAERFIIVMYCVDVT